MNTVKLEDLSDSLRELYQRGVQAGESGNYKYAFQMLRSLLRKQPGFLAARKRLREFELKELGGKSSIFRRLWADCKGRLLQGKAKGLCHKEQYSEALDVGEAAMQLDATSAVCCGVLAYAAEEADILEVAVDALEVACDHHPDEPDLMDRLAQLYLKTRRGDKALVLYQKLCKIDPMNKEWAKLKNEASKASAADQGWDKYQADQGWEAKKEE